MKVASETVRESLKQLDSRYMSDEEDGEEGEGGAWVVRSPPCRSQRLSSLLRRLQERVNSKQTPSSHPPNPRVQECRQCAAHRNPHRHGQWIGLESIRHQLQPLTHRWLRSSKKLQGTTEQLRLRRCHGRVDTGRHPVVSKRE